MILAPKCLVIRPSGDPKVVLFDDEVPVIVNPEDESLFEAVLKHLRDKGVDVQPTDTLYFPDAHPDYREIPVLQ